ncbi:putative zinc finger protein [Cardiosporidium cionae]|uniref:Zinc finger protein n=1 Tax=Cardiosporidium cionae TaxID=476202 RepID=A0ABQ7J897_9APIC|nr:putative zinc finger protein [Cardiosporidium cionae]|eukprot:KAF8820224.1 putative zinc finger protein [Cardiosporidium cionae]
MAPPCANRKRPFYKTKICPWYYKNRCDRGEECLFAHSQDELRAAPNLAKTSICPNVRLKGTCDDSTCTFAHKMKELRHTRDLYKTAMCMRYTKGYCNVGDQCRHAHGEHELQHAPKKLFKTDRKKMEVGSHYSENISTAASSTVNRFDEFVLNSDRQLNLSSLALEGPSTHSLGCSGAYAAEISRSSAFETMEHAPGFRRKGVKDSFSHSIGPVAGGKNDSLLNSSNRTGQALSSSEMKACALSYLMRRDGKFPEKIPEGDVSALVLEQMKRSNLDHSEYHSYNPESRMKSESIKFCLSDWLNNSQAARNLSDWMNQPNPEDLRQSVNISNDASVPKYGLMQSYPYTESSVGARSSSCENGSAGMDMEGKYAQYSPFESIAFSVPPSYPNSQSVSTMNSFNSFSEIWNHRSYDPRKLETDSVTPAYSSNKIHIEPRNTISGLPESFCELSARPSRPPVSYHEFLAPSCVDMLPGDRGCAAICNEQNSLSVKEDASDSSVKSFGNYHSLNFGGIEGEPLNNFYNEGSSESTRTPNSSTVSTVGDAAEASYKDCRFGMWFPQCQAGLKITGDSNLYSEKMEASHSGTPHYPTLAMNAAVGEFFDKSIVYMAGNIANNSNDEHLLTRSCNGSNEPQNRSPYNMNSMASPAPRSNAGSSPQFCENSSNRDTSLSQAMQELLFDRS